MRLFIRLVSVSMLLVFGCDLIGPKEPTLELWDVLYSTGPDGDINDEYVDVYWCIHTIGKCGDIVPEVWFYAGRPYTEGAKELRNNPDKECIGMSSEDKRFNWYTYYQMQVDSLETFGFEVIHTDWCRPPFN